MSRSFWGTKQPSTSPAKDPSSPAASSSPTGSVASLFKTNVNRKKTKRWVEAKSYSYDGDDWGEVEEQDDYSPQGKRSQSISKPTGLRQKGQGVTSTTTSSGATLDARPLSFDPDDTRNTSAEPGLSREQSTSTSHPTQTAGATNQQRPYQANSSQGPPLIPRLSSQGPPSLQIETQLDRLGAEKLSTTSPQSLRSPVGHSSAPVRQLSADSWSGQNAPSASSAPLGDSPGRRDLRGVHVDTPYPIRPSSGTEADNGLPNTGSFPPRKSSLTQSAAVPADEDSPAIQARAPILDHPSDRVETEMHGRGRASSNPMKPLPFIRPADIYKRIEEERERERRSLDSGRPSEDSTDSRSPYSDQASRNRGGNEARSSVPPGHTEEGENHPSTKTKLDTVKERKSEYGMEWMLSSNDARVSSGSNNTPHAARETDFGQAPGLNVAHPNTQLAPGGTPMLPHLERLSGFGDQFWPASEPTRPDSMSVTSHQGNVSQPSQAVQGMDKPNPDSRLLSQPSHGLRSVVHQAFDASDDKSTPPTPSSAEVGSGANSDPQRSDSTSTSGISPIMSRAPTAAGAGPNSRSIAAITEENSEPIDGAYDKLRTTSSIPHPPGSPETSVPIQSSQPNSSDSLGRVVSPGHRRDLSTPSVTNSPARSPLIEASKEVPTGVTVEVDNASPLEDVAPEVRLDAKQPSLLKFEKTQDRPRALDSEESTRLFSKDEDSDRPASDGRDNARDIPVNTTFKKPTRISVQPIEPHPQYRIPGAGSPSKGKVRDLASKFEAEAASGGLSQSSSRTASPSGHDQDELNKRPPPRSDPSFRPALPGSWISYATTTGPTSTTLDDTPSAEFPPELNNGKTGVRNDRDEPSMQTAANIINRSNDEHVRDPADSGSRLEELRAEEHASNAHIGDTPQPDSTEVASKDSAEVHMSDNASTPDAENLNHLSNVESSPSELAHTQVTPGTSGARDVSPDASVAPLKHQRTEQDGPLKPLFQASKPTIHTKTSRDTSPSDQESDRLRREIVDSLSPQTFEPTVEKQADPAQPSNRHNLVPLEPPKDNRESTVLPSEYDSYWASTPREHEPYQHQSPQEDLGERDYDPSRSLSPSPNVDTLGNDRVQPSNSIQASSRTADDSQKGSEANPIEDNQAETPASVGQQGEAQAFKSESEEAPLNPTDAASQNDVDNSPGSDLEAQYGDCSSHSPKLSLAPTTATVHAQYPEVAGASAQSPFENPVEIEAPHSMAVPVEQREPLRVKGDERLSRPMSYFPEASELGAPRQYDAGNEAQPSDNIRTKPLEQPSQPDDMMRVGRLTNFETTPPVPEKELPIHTDTQDSIHSGLELVADVRSEPEPSTITPTKPLAIGNIPTFQHIQSLSSAAERINAYDSARKQFAGMETGLTFWISAMAARYPIDSGHVGSEHSQGSANASGMGAAGHQMSPTDGTPMGDLMHQTSHQQNATSSNIGGWTQPLSSSPTKYNLTADPGSSHNQASGSGGGKSSSQTVQAKGKDLLHSAGVLGGRANVAAKGLFAKGKSKWRASGSERADH